jgi:hypothetical protein
VGVAVYAEAVTVCVIFIPRSNVAIDFMARLIRSYHCVRSQRCREALHFIAGGAINHRDSLPASVHFNSNEGRSSIDSWVENLSKRDLIRTRVIHAPQPSLVHFHIKSATCTLTNPRSCPLGFRLLESSVIVSQPPPSIAPAVTDLLASLMATATR